MHKLKMIRVRVHWGGCDDVDDDDEDAENYKPITSLEIKGIESKHEAIAPECKAK
jgi:hypothetical protein